MKRLLTLTLLAMAAAAFTSGTASAWERPRVASRNAECTAASSAWHGGYYHAAWGSPVALVVPPTAEYQTKWGWGVGNTRVVPIAHQFGRTYPGPFVPGTGFLPTPRWPSDTDQFGVYYVRGPW